MNESDLSDSDLKNISDLEVLKYAAENGMVDLHRIREEMDMKKKQELLAAHPYTIYQGKDGKWYTYLPDEKRGRILKRRNTKKEIEKIAIDYQKQQLENPTLQEVFDEWNDRRLELEKISKSTHRRNTQIFNRHYDNFRRKRIKSISPEWIEDFLERQIPEFQLTAKSFSNLKTVTRGFLKRAKKRKLIDYSIDTIISEMDISDRDFKKVIKEDYEEVFDEEETEKMMQYLFENPDLRNLGILLVFVTGIRVGELVALKHEDFNGNTFKIRRTEVRYPNESGKGSIYEVKEFPKTDAGVRTAIIPPDFEWLAKRIRLQNPFGEYIFMENGKRLTTHTIRNRLRKICRKLEIYPKSPHKIRKTYGSILIDNHVDNRLIIDLMGHTNILCTEQHYHRNRKTVDRKSDVLASIPEFQAK